MNPANDEKASEKQMLDIMKEDWTIEGESVDSILREINRLEGQKN